MCSADNLKTMNRAITLVIVIYTIAALTAALTFVALPHLDLIYRVLMADLTATGVVFIASAAFQNSSLYDPYWSLAPPLIGGFFVSQPTRASAAPRSGLDFTVGRSSHPKLVKNLAEP